MRINVLLKDIDWNGYQCIGKPEPLSGNLSGYWSMGIFIIHLWHILGQCWVKRLPGILLSLVLAKLKLILT